MKYFQIILLVSLSFILGSCFEIVEDITIKKNGSGHVKIILNASQSRTDINALLLLKEINGYPVPSIDQMNSKINAFKDTVKKMIGFSNVMADFDDENFIIIFEADFDKVERLNNGVYNLWAKFDPNNAKREAYLKFGNNEFSRQPGQLFNLLHQKMKASDKKVLNGAAYTSVYRFSQVISSQQNTSAKTSKNRNVSFLKLPLQLMVEKPSYWYNTIILKP